MRRTAVALVAPWVPPPRQDTKVTMPPPPGGEVGGTFGVSTGYSDRLARTPFWKRMAHSTYELRMRENATTYPMSAYRPGEYDIRYTLMPYPDSQKHRPLLEIGEPRMIPRIHIPVVFLVNLFDDAAGVWFGKKYETVYVEPHLAREELIPQRYAIYATPEAYELLGLPVIHHSVHEEIPKDTASYQKLMEKQNYVEERWKYTIEYLFRKYEDGPPELLDRSEEDWDGVETIGSSASEGDKAAGGGTRKGPLKQRKARKIKLF